MGNTFISIRITIERENNVFRVFTMERIQLPSIHIEVVCIGSSISDYNLCIGC